MIGLERAEENLSLDTEKLWNQAPIGMALLRQDGTVETLNLAGQEILSVTSAGGRELRFELGGHRQPSTHRGPFSWAESRHAKNGGVIELSCRAEAIGDGFSMVFEDVTQRRRRERRAGAVARTASELISDRSLSSVLTALAYEILKADGLAGVQILTRDSDSEKLQVLGMAGFTSLSAERFLEQLMECKNRGARLCMFEVMESSRAAVFPHRYGEVMADPAWEPMHEVLRFPVWDAFASLPISVHNQTIGILNLYLTPGLPVDGEALEFFSTMAVQAGVVLDYAALLESERSSAERAERQRLARDLHDSVVQGAFSMRMQVQALRVLTGSGELLANRKKIDRIAGDLDEISGAVLGDLRNLVHRTKPAPVIDKGLGTALRTLASGTSRRTGIDVQLRISGEIEKVSPPMAEDTYFIVSEAIHNAVKHSSTDRIDVKIDAFDDGDALTIVIRDYGVSANRPEGVEHGHATSGKGIVFMEQRARNWNGSLTIDFDDKKGSTVTVDIPSLAHGQG